MKKILLSLIIVGMMLSGCQTVRSLIPISIDRNPLIVPTVTPSEQYPFDWYVLTAENANDKFKEITDKGGPPEVFAITPGGFKNLNLSMAELRKYIKEQQAIISAYQEYYAKSDTMTTPTK